MAEVGAVRKVFEAKATRLLLLNPRFHQHKVTMLFPRDLCFVCRKNILSCLSTRLIEND